MPPPSLNLYGFSRDLLVRQVVSVSGIGSIPWGQSTNNRLLQYQQSYQQMRRSPAEGCENQRTRSPLISGLSSTLAEGSGSRRRGSWCPGAGSNHRHCDFQSHALPTELPGRSREPAKRLEGAAVYSQAGPLCPPRYAFQSCVAQRANPKGFAWRSLASSRWRGVSGKARRAATDRHVTY